MAIQAKASAQSSGIGFLGLLCIVLLVLKALGFIAVSWWWVFAPLWAPIAIVAGLWIAFICTIAFINWMAKTKKRARK